MLYIYHGVACSCPINDIHMVNYFLMSLIPYTQPYDQFQPVWHPDYSYANFNFSSLLYKHAYTPCWYLPAVNVFEMQWSLSNMYVTVYICPLVMYQWHALYVFQSQVIDTIVIQQCRYKSHIVAETKWPPFSRLNFQMHFLEWKCKNFD